MAVLAVAYMQLKRGVGVKGKSVPSQALTGKVSSDHRDTKGNVKGSRMKRGRECYFE